MYRAAVGRVGTAGSEPQQQHSHLPCEGERKKGVLLCVNSCCYILPLLFLLSLFIVHSVQLQMLNITTTAVVIATITTANVAITAAAATTTIATSITPITAATTLQPLLHYYYEYNCSFLHLIIHIHMPIFLHCRSPYST